MPAAGVSTSGVEEEPPATRRLSFGQVKVVAGVSDIAHPLRHRSTAGLARTR